MNAEALETGLTDQRETVMKNARRGSSIFVKKRESLHVTHQVGEAAIARSTSSRSGASTQLRDSISAKLVATACTSRAAAAILSKRTTLTTVNYVFEAGPIGIILKTGTNHIKKVDYHSQAEAQNVAPGGTLVQVNGEIIGEGTALQAISKVPRPVTVTVLYQGSKAVKHKDDGSNTTMTYPAVGSGTAEPNVPTFTVRAARDDAPTDSLTSRVSGSV